ncbi:MAG: hypothetical protein JO051_17980 [Acidobacteriaceae bacterium]|nr:hypothetical protein [Acidobacteriaceae bacterium]
MPEQIYKLTPDRDLQCYFFMPSSIAAMSQSGDNGFTVSGKWRQQFDWAVVEWNRDNTFEHPALRYLPDGDLSGLKLSYTERRSGCIPFESNLSPIVDWNDLRIWATPPGGIETLYQVFFIPPSGTPTSGITTTPVGSYTQASATMTLVSPPGVGKRAGVAMLEQHYYYTQTAGDTLANIAAGIAANINQFGASNFSASSNGPALTITLNAANWGAVPNPLLGANGNRLMVYGFAEGGAQVWQQPATYFAGGQFPSAYQVTLDVGNLTGRDNSTLEFVKVPTSNIRKMRWTWTADLQPGIYSQTEFQVQISNWTVTGQNRIYSVAGPGSRRIEDSDPSVIYAGPWSSTSGNYSASTIGLTQTPNATCTINYQEANPHELYLGTRLLTSGTNISVSVDGQPLAQPTTLALDGEDVLVRLPLGTYAAGTHTVILQHEGPPPTDTAAYDLFFDFLEIAYPSTNLPDFNQNTLSLATDWDTYHSQSLPAERTAWLIQKLGFFGRVNHYVGALWFYEIFRPGTQYSSLTVTFVGENPKTSPMMILDIAGTTKINHLVLLDDTPSTIAQVFAGLINQGTNLLWASANGPQLTVTARAMGPDGDNISVQLDSSSQGFGMQGGGRTSGGVYGTPYNLETTSNDNAAILNKTLITSADYWRTDFTASPSINRAARDWHLAYYQALKAYGIDVVTSFSTELMNGDPDPASGIVQVYPDGTPVVLNTPSIQTNFSPKSTAYWTQNYLAIASLESAAGLQPYLQFGEVQWWYFPNPSGMPFYDAYTQQQFQAKYGAAMQIIPSNTAPPSAFPNEMAFLPTVIAAYTAAIRSAVLNQFPTCRFEVLYPNDTNNTDLNRIVNYASSDWTPENLTALKTESFGFTGSNNLDLSTYSISVSASKGFTTSQRSHLVGIGSAYNAWGKEVDIAQAQGLDSVVLFALDQYCLIGYAPPPFVTSTRTVRLG